MDQVGISFACIKIVKNRLKGFSSVRASFHWHFLKKEKKDCTRKTTAFWEVNPLYLTTSLLSNPNPLIHPSPPEFLLLSQGDFFCSLLRFSR